MAPTDPLQGHVGKETKGCLLLRASQSTLVLKANGLLNFPSHVFEHHADANALPYAESTSQKRPALASTPENAQRYYNAVTR